MVRSLADRTFQLRWRVGHPAGSACGRLRVRGWELSYPPVGAPGPDFAYSNFSGGRGLDVIYTDFSGGPGFGAYLHKVSGLL